MLIEFPFTIDDIRGNPEAVKCFKGLTAFEFDEGITLIIDPDNKVPCRWDTIPEAKKDLGEIVKKETI